MLTVRGVRAGKGEAGEVATFKGKRHLKAGMSEQLKSHDKGIIEFKTQ